MPEVCEDDDARVKNVGVENEKIDLDFKTKKFSQKNDYGTEKNVKYNTTVNEKKRTKN
jgi:hypothetical protein